MSKPQLAQLILVGTGFVVAAVLLLWLILWMRGGPSPGIRGAWIAQRGPGSVPIGHQAEDLRAVTGRRPASGGVPDTSHREVLAQLRGALAESKGRPVVVYLSAAGVTIGSVPILLPTDAASLPDPGRADHDQVTVERILDVVGESPARQVLLILDAGQVGTDRNLGVYGNGFLDRLAETIRAREPKGLAILTSCAPGQLAWGSEADGRSVFAHFVALGLSGQAAGADPDEPGRLTVRALHRYVRDRVANWVRSSRGGAEQTPELLLGEPGLNFALRQVAPPAYGPSSEEDEKATEELLGRLDAAWNARDVLEASHPERFAPLLWQDYLEVLLRAELLTRIGARAEARGLLDLLPARVRALESAGPPPVERPWALAVAGRSAGADEASGLIDQAFDEMFPDARPGEPSDAEPAASSSGPTDETPASGSPASPDAAESDTPEAGPEPTKAAGREQAARPKPALAARRGGAFRQIVDPGDTNKPRYVEAQLLVWAEAFNRQVGVADHFQGPRGLLLVEAMRLRRLAEAAAAPDERVARWVAPLVEAGDAARRRAQDELFAAPEDRLQDVGEHFDRARAAYARAVEAADRSARAVDLLARLQAELPYFGQWKARRVGRDEPTFDPEFDALLALTDDLARELTADPPQVGRGVEAGVDPFAEHSTRLSKLEALAARARNAAESLRKEFLAACGRLAGGGSRESWREVDEVLRVPFIPAQTRRRLLEIARSAAIASSLEGASAGPAPQAPSPASSREEYLAKRAKQAGRIMLGAGRAGTAEPVGDVGASRRDPSFDPVALRMARLERALLAIGGMPEDRLARIDDAIAAAQRATAGDPAEAYDRLSSAIRSLRSARLDALAREKPAGLPEALAHDRAARVLAPVDALASALGGDKPTATLARFLRHDLMVWHARRLIDDFSPGHASALLREAVEFAESESWSAAAAAAEAMRPAHLALMPDPTGEVVLKGWDEQDFGLQLARVGPVPAGEVTLVPGFDPTLPIGVTLARSGLAAGQTSSVPIPEGDGSGRVDFLLVRTEATPGAETFDLEPRAFFRGRVFPAGRAVRVGLPSVAEPVRIGIRQSYKILDREIPDQFKEHPGRGFMHPTYGLRFNLVISSDEAQRVWVRHALEREGEELAESVQSQILNLSPRSDRVVPGDGGASDHTGFIGPEMFLLPGKTMFDTVIHLVVTVRKGDANGPVLSTRRYPFRVIPPSQYVAVEPVFDPSTRTLTLWILHRRDDPVTGPINVSASMGNVGGVQEFTLRRGQYCHYIFKVPSTTPTASWSVQVEGLPAAIKGEIETPIPTPPPGAQPSPP